MRKQQNENISTTIVYGRTLCTMMIGPWSYSTKYTGVGYELSLFNLARR